MSCKSIQSKLSAYLDGEMSGVEMQSIRTHVNRCHDCNKELDGLKSVQAILKGIPSCPEPSMQLAATIMQSVSVPKRNYFRLGIVLAVPVIAITIASYPRPISTKIEDRNSDIKRELSKDQIFDAGNDSTSGASLVHYTSYESR